MSRTYPYAVSDYDENDVLDRIVFNELFPKLSDKEQVVLSLRLDGFTQGAISRLLNISRTSIGSIEKQATQRLQKMVAEG